MKTKYNIGQTVYLVLHMHIHFYAIKKGHVVQITIKNNENIYIIKTDNGHETLEEKQIISNYKTAKKILIKIANNDIKEIKKALKEELGNHADE